MPNEPLILAAQDVEAPGAGVRGAGLISSLHTAAPGERAEVYRRYESELLE